VNHEIKDYGDIGHPTGKSTEPFSLNVHGLANIRFHSPECGVESFNVPYLYADLIFFFKADKLISLFKSGCYWFFNKEVQPLLEEFFCNGVVGAGGSGNNRGVASFSKVVEGCEAGDAVFRGHLFGARGVEVKHAGAFNSCLFTGDFSNQFCMEFAEFADAYDADFHNMKSPVDAVQKFCSVACRFSGCFCLWLKRINFVFEKIKGDNESNNGQRSSHNVRGMKIHAVKNAAAEGAHDSGK